jgi:putative endonuclease
LQRLYFIYILTNASKTVLYTGVTNNLPQRLTEHYLGSGKKAFTHKYKCYYLVYFESTKYIDIAIKREKEIKGWIRKKKEELIATMNPEWRFLNTDILEKWPPKEEDLIRKEDT